MTALAITGPGAVSAAAPPPWRQWLAELWWVLRLADALLVLTLRTVVRGVCSIPMQARLPLFAVALAGFMAVKATTGYLDDPRPVMTILAAPLIVVGLFSLFCAWVMSGLAPVTDRTAHGSMTTRMTVTGKTDVTTRYVASTRPKTPMMTARHEGGHAAAIEAVGGTVVYAKAYADGSGICRGRLPRMSKLHHRVINYMSVMVAGEVAVHSKSGCGHDQHWATWACNQLPEGERRAAWHRAYAMARSAQRTHAGTAKRVAYALYKTGHYQGSGGSEHYM